MKLLKSILCLALFIPLVFTYPWIPNSGWPDQIITILFGVYTWTYLLAPRKNLIVYFEIAIWFLLSGLQIWRIIEFSNEIFKLYSFYYIVFNFVILISSYVYYLVRSTRR